MCKALDINPMTLKGRKDARREEGGKQERKEGRRRSKGNTNAEKPRPFSAYKVLWTWIFRASSTTARVSCLCVPHRTLSYYRMNSGGDSPLAIVQLSDSATDSRIY